jgi:hypothetical protein
LLDKTPTVDYAEPSARDAQTAGGGGGGFGGGGGGGGSVGGGVKNVFVGNLPAGASDEVLRSIFCKYGEVRMLGCELLAVG